MNYSLTCEQKAMSKMRHSIVWIVICFSFSIGFASVTFAQENTDSLKQKFKQNAVKAQEGDSAAQAYVGYAYETGTGVAQDQTQAVTWYRKAANQGNAYAQSNLGLCYETGTGVTKDEARAVAWYRKAAEQGYAIAQADLGSAYEVGKGVTKDETQAVVWYRQAADQGNALAQHNLGVCYEQGTGVTKDDAQAAAWYRKAAEQGFAHAQNNLGHCCVYGKGIPKDEPQAVTWYRKAAEQGFADAQESLGFCYQRGTGVAKDDAKAIAWYLAAKEVREKEFGREHPKYANALVRLADQYSAMGSYNRAEPLLIEAKGIFENVLGKEHPDYAQAVYSLAVLNTDLGAYGRAETFALEAKQISEKGRGKQHPEYAKSVMALADVYRNMGAYERAETLNLEAKQILEKVFGKEHHFYAASTSSLATLYEIMGAYERAEPLQLEAKQILEKVRGKEHPDFAHCLGSLADLYLSMGEYERAEPLYLEAKQIREKVFGKEHPSYANTLNNLAILYKEMGSYDLAKPIYFDVKKIYEKVFGKDHPRYALALSNLANLHKSTGSYKNAESFYLEAKEIRKKAFGKESEQYASSLYNLSALYAETGEYKRAKPLMLEARQILKDTLGAEHPRCAVSFLGLANLHQNLGLYERAERLYLEASRNFQNALGKEHPNYTNCLNGLANLFAIQKQYSKSVLWRDQARKSLANHIAKVLPTLSAKRQQAYLKENFHESLQAALSVAYESRSMSRSATLSAGWLLNSKAIVHQTLAEASLLSTPEAAGFVQQLRVVRKQLAELTLNSAKAATQKTRTRLVELENREREINKELAAFRLIDVDNPWVSIGQVQSNIPLGSVLINIARFTPRDIKEKKDLDPVYAAWIIPASGEGEVKLISLGDATKIETQIAGLRKQLNASVAKKINQTGELVFEQEFTRQSKQISQLAFAPLEKHLSGIEEILISPDGELWTIPWEALRTADDKYVLEKYRIRYLTSGRELASNRRKGRYSSAPVIMADPDYDLKPAEIGNVDKRNKQVLRSAATATFARLPSSRSEATAIKTPLEGYTNATAKMLLGSAAQESAFKQLHRPQSLVISTHGYFEKSRADKANPQSFVNPLLRCGLALAGANNRQQAVADGKEDGILTGLEIVGTDLRGTELVVLSACETGLGDITSGEGVAGLRQAFQLAGAQSVVSSLWQVEDGETARLMKLFFQNLAAGKSKSESLRQAQLTRIKARRARHGAAHPFFWAAFTLTGQD